MKRLAVFVASAPVAFVLTTVARAQCPSWDARFSPAGTDGEVHALVLFDDGSGPTLYAGGAFTSAGGESANYIARWDGQSWSPLGNGVNGTVFALAVFDDGSGPALYAGGSFTTAGAVSASHIARWNGGNWTALGSGTNDIVYVLEVFDDGLGSALFAGGQFTTAGGGSANRVAKWSGSGWSALGGGTNNSVRALEVFDDGSGPALFVGGRFSTAGVVSAARIAKWQGGAWSALGSGIDDRVLALTVFDDGGGPALFVGGQFLLAGGVAAANVAKWDGANFSALGTGTDASVNALQAFDDGSGAALFAGGSFTTAGGTSVGHVARWDGVNWTSTSNGTDGDVDVLAVFDSGAGTELVAGGSFEQAQGALQNHVARWNGAQWRALGAGGPATVVGAASGIATLAVFDDGSGPALCAGGGFSEIGGVVASCVAKWDGVNWSPLGSGMAGGFLGSPFVSALAVYDDGSGPELYACGHFDTAGGVAANLIAKWDGANWSPLGTGISGEVVHALAVYDDGSGPALYAGGYFDGAGGVLTQHIAKWDGASWSSVAGGVSSPMPFSTEVFSLQPFDDGAGTKLYVGGFFTSAGGVPAIHVASWNGSSFSAVGGGTSDRVTAMTSHDDGSGTALYACGYFSNAGGVTVNHVAKWNGSSWSALGSGLDGLGFPIPFALASFDDGSGSELYAGGYFTTAGGAPAEHLAKWNGATWSEVGGGIPLVAGTPVTSFQSFDDGLDGAADLYIGGRFDTVGDQASKNIAEWHGCPNVGPGVAFCFPGDAGVVNCPCVPPSFVPNPQAAPGHGCANSLNLDGAMLSATGTTSPDTVAFTGYVSPTYVSFGLLLKGNANAPGGVASADGVRCADGQLIRFGAHFAGTNGAPQGYWTYPNTVQTNPVSVQTLQPTGQTAYYQLFYRNPAANFCTAATTNWSNGVRIAWP